jgi:hypothetical protein
MPRTQKPGRRVLIIDLCTAPGDVAGRAAERAGLTMRVLSLLAVVVLVAGCGASNSMRTASHGTNNCGTAYTLSAGTLSAATTCGGVVGEPPIAVVRLRLGERFTVAQARESTGKLDFPTLLPRGDAVTLSVNHGASASYIAAHTGRSQLVAHHTIYCWRPSRRGCVAFVVLVEPRHR